MSLAFEILMMVCFGAAWPFAFYRIWTTKQAGGQSLLFLTIIELGYVAGIAFKLTGKMDIAFALYLINFLQVAAVFLLTGYFRYYAPTGTEGVSK